MPDEDSDAATYRTITYGYDTAQQAFDKIPELAVALYAFSANERSKE